MSKALQYQGYSGTVALDDDDHTFYGYVINLRDVIAFEGKTVDELESSFRTAVDAYLELCAQQNVDPDPQPPPERVDCPRHRSLRPYPRPGFAAGALRRRSRPCPNRST